MSIAMLSTHSRWKKLALFDVDARHRREREGSDVS